MPANEFTSNLSEEKTGNALLNETKNTPIIKNETFFSNLKDEASNWATHFYHKNIEKKTSDIMVDSAIDFYWFLYGKAKSYGLLAIAALFLIGLPVVPILLSAFIIFQSCQSSINPILSYFSKKFGIPAKATNETKDLFKKKSILKLASKRTDKLIDKKINDLKKQLKNTTKSISAFKESSLENTKLIQTYNIQINNLRAQIKNGEEFKMKASNENFKLIDECSNKLYEKPYIEQRWMENKTKKLEKSFNKLNSKALSYTESSISKDPPETKTFSYQKENQNPLLLKKEALKLDSNIPDKNNEQSSYPNKFQKSMTAPLNEAQRLNKNDKLEQSKNALLPQPNSHSLPSKPANGARR